MSVVIVMPAWNSATTIGDALRSVRAQTFTDWRLVIVDDASTDNTAGVARAAADDDARIDIVRLAANLGAAGARNAGIARAGDDSEFVAFLDADDLWLPGYLARMTAALHSMPQAGMAFSRLESFTEHGKGVAQDMNGLVGGLHGGTRMAEHFLDHPESTPGPQSAVVRRRVLVDVGGFDDATFRNNFTDQSLFLKIALRHSIAFVDECLCLYRQHDASATSRSVREGAHATRECVFCAWALERVSSAPPAVRRAAEARSWRALQALGPAALKPASPAGAAARRLVRLMSEHPLSALAAAGRGRPLGRVIKGAGRRLRAPLSRLRLSLGLVPLSSQWGADRGTPLHRRYLEQFLDEHRALIRGRVLEFSDRLYTTTFGTGVTASDVVDLSADNPVANIVTDLTRESVLAAGTYDCIICTHVLHVVMELDAFVAETARIVADGGALLVAVPQSSMADARWGELWRFTPEGLRRVLLRHFDEVDVVGFGNSLIAAGEMRGLVVEDFSAREFEHQDVRFAIEVCAVARKPKRSAT